MLTPDGQQWLARLLAERLTGGMVWVSDGTQEAESQIESVEVVKVDDAYGVQVETTFGSTAANFEWSRNAVKLPDGTILDADQTDGGRKAVGSAWTIAVVIKVG